MPLGVDLDSPLTPDEVSAIADSIARRIVARRLEVPAVFLLEMHKPLSFVASQAVLAAMPFLAPVVGAQRMADLSRLLADRANVELLIDRIEQMAAARDEKCFPPCKGGTVGGRQRAEPPPTPSS